LAIKARKWRQLHFGAWTLDYSLELGCWNLEFPWVFGSLDPWVIQQGGEFLRKAEEICEFPQDAPVTYCRLMPPFVVFF